MLAPNFDKWDHSTVQNWIKKLHKAGNSIETVLSFSTEPNSEAESLKITNRSMCKHVVVVLLLHYHHHLFLPHFIFVSIQV